jgi:hypothetical protein
MAEGYGPRGQLEGMASLSSMKPRHWGLQILKPTSLLCGAEILWEEVQRGSEINGDASIVR